MSIIRVTVRSSGPAGGNSTEQLKIRLKQAVANMEVNEQMEVNENRRRRPPMQSGQIARRPGPSSPPPSRAGSQISSVSSKDSQVSPMTRYPSSDTSVRKRQPQSYQPPAPIPTASRVVARLQNADKLPVVVRRSAGPVVRRPAAGSLDDGEYCIKRYRRESRTGGEWEVIKKSHYSYWPPRRYTS